MCVFMGLYTEHYPESENTTTLCLSKRSRLISYWLELWSRLRPIQSQLGLPFIKHHKHYFVCRD